MILTARMTVEGVVSSGVHGGASGLSSVTSGTPRREAGDTFDGRPDRALTRVRERFISGEDVGGEIRPAVLRSWRRCRDGYGVDPLRARAPAADDVPGHSLDEAVVLAALGAGAAAITPQLESPAGLVAVGDGAGRVLSTAGDRRAIRRGEETNLAPWSAWSERHSGTTAIGLALEEAGPARVAGREHWCEGFRAWSSTAIAIRDPVTGQPLGVLGISFWRQALPAAAPAWLRGVVRLPLTQLRRQAERTTAQFVTAFQRHRPRCRGGLMAVDRGGRVVAADARAERLLGVRRPTPGAELPYEQPELRRLVSYAIEQGLVDRSWVGSAALAFAGGSAAVPVTLWPVFLGDDAIGALIAAETRTAQPLEAEWLRSRLPPEGQVPRDPSPPRAKPLVDLRDEGSLPADPPPPRANRIAGVCDGRLVLVSPREVRFAEADGNDVWLTTDRGRLVARVRGLGRLAGALEDSRFLRVHRRFLVNLDRVREIEPAFKGSLWLVMDAGHRREVVPVSRRRAPELRRALGI
jgi:sigma-54 dependent transcriptional regulator, acetoin dehydrogenase operon transcriptional activator AcoR